ncbi:MAG: hypothetical protein H7831_13160 [Magnetococcus sp. WYHC-3]
MFPGRMIASALLAGAAMARQRQTDQLFQQAESMDDSAHQLHESTKKELLHTSRSAVESLRSLGEARLRMVATPLRQTALQILDTPQLMDSLEPEQRDLLGRVQSIGEQAHHLTAYGPVLSPFLLVGVGAFGIQGLATPDRGESFLTGLRSQVAQSCSIRWLVTGQTCDDHHTPHHGLLGGNTDHLVVQLAQSALEREQLARQWMENAQQNVERSRRSTQEMLSQAGLFADMALVADHYRTNMEEAEARTSILLRRLTPSRIAAGDVAPSVLDRCLRTCSLLDALCQRPLVNSDGSFHETVAPLLLEQQQLALESAESTTTPA